MSLIGDYSFEATYENPANPDEDRDVIIWFSIGDYGARPSGPTLNHAGEPGYGMGFTFEAVTELDGRTRCPNLDDWGIQALVGDYHDFAVDAVEEATL